MTFLCPRTGVEEGIVGQCVKQRGLLHNLEDRVLNRWRIGIWQRVEIEGNYGNSVGKLL